MRIAVTLPRHDKTGNMRVTFAENGRGDWIRTSDFYVPNVALYQAELHPEVAGNKSFLNEGRHLNPFFQECNSIPARNRFFRATTRLATKRWFIERIIVRFDG